MHYKHAEYLAGTDYWDWCDRCKGKGWVHTGQTTTNTGAVEAITTEQCGWCQGHRIELSSHGRLIHEIVLHTQDGSLAEYGWNAELEEVSVLD